MVGSREAKCPDVPTPASAGAPVVLRFTLSVSYRPGPSEGDTSGC
jgi:hypothetical protein